MTLSVRAKKRLGNCYELAGKAAIFDEINTVPGADMTLVHGAVGPNKNPHAWVEWEDGNDGWEDPGMVWEPIEEKVWPRPIYYAVFRATFYARYTTVEVSERALTTKNWGPWDGEYETTMVGRKKKIVRKV